MLLQLMYGARTAEALAATNAMNQIRLAELFASTIAEHAGIVAASAIYSFGRVSGVEIASSPASAVPSALSSFSCSSARLLLSFAPLHS